MPPASQGWEAHRDLKGVLEWLTLGTGRALIWDGIEA